jgi:diguanylate cyclase (GGDEF)-like protein/PAS domain S-box-containing protein
MRDMSAQVQAREALNRQTAILRSVAEAIPAIVAVVGADQRYRFVNGAFERWIGSTRERIIGRTVREVIGRQDQERSQPWIDRVLAGETVTFEREYLAQGQSHHFAASYVPLWSDSGGTDGFVGVLQDISRHRHEEVRLLNLSQMDPLTGLLNRAGFEYTLAQQLSSGGGPSLALLYIDLDRFKPVNDTHGHPVGDEVLKAFAQRLRGLVRPTDAVSRLGGDEFVVLLQGVRAQGNAEAVAAKVIESAQMPFQLGGLNISVGASVGVAFGVGVDGTAQDLLARGDAMLYSAKQRGRGRLAGGAGHGVKQARATGQIRDALTMRASSHSALAE